MNGIQSALAQWQIDRESHSFEILFQEQLFHAESDFSDRVDRLRLSIQLWPQEHLQDPLKGSLAAQRVVVLEKKLQQTAYEAIEKQIEKVSREFQNKINIYNAFQNRNSSQLTDPLLHEKYIENFSEEGLQEVEEELDILKAQFTACPEAYQQASISRAMNQLLQLRTELDRVCKQASEHYPVEPIEDPFSEEEESQTKIVSFELETLSVEDPKDAFKKIIDILISLFLYFRILIQIN